MNIRKSKAGLIWAKLEEIQERLSQQRSTTDSGIRQIQKIVCTTACSAKHPSHQ